MEVAVRFNFEDGQTREYNAGQKFHGLKIDNKRPLSVTLTRKDLMEISNLGTDAVRYLIYIHSVLKF